MLSIEYTYKRMRLFWIELSLMVVAVLAVLILLWQMLSFLRLIKWANLLWFVLLFIAQGEATSVFGISQSLRRAKHRKPEIVMLFQ